MGYGYACPGWEGDFSCFIKKKHTGDSSISYGSTLYEKYCKKDYERNGYGDCPHFYWYTHQYIVTAVLKKLFPSMKTPEFEISRDFRTRVENAQSCKSSLDRYDIVGPILARIVENDNELVKDIYINTIIPVTALIYQGKDNEALILYMKMVRDLIEKVKEPLQNSINTTIPYIVINQTNLTKMPNSKQEKVKILKRK